RCASSGTRAAASASRRSSRAPDRSQLNRATGAGTLDSNLPFGSSPPMREIALPVLSCLCTLSLLPGCGGYDLGSDYTSFSGDGTGSYDELGDEDEGYEDDDYLEEDDDEESTEESGGEPVCNDVDEVVLYL